MDPLTMLIIGAVVIAALAIIYNQLLKTSLAEQGRKKDCSIAVQTTKQAEELTKQTRAQAGAVLIGKVDNLGLKEAPNATLSISQIGDSLNVSASKNETQHGLNIAPKYVLAQAPEPEVILHGSARQVSHSGEGIHLTGPEAVKGFWDAVAPPSVVVDTRTQQKPDAKPADDKKIAA